MNDTHRISTNSFHEKYSFLKFEFVNCSKFKYLPQNHLHKTFFSAETIQGWKLFVEIQYLYYVCTLLLSKKSDCEAQSNVCTTSNFNALSTISHHFASFCLLSESVTLFLDFLYRPGRFVPPSTMSRDIVEQGTNQLGL